jgi:hypothetical protein
MEPWTEASAAVQRLKQLVDLGGVVVDTRVAVVEEAEL